MDETLFGKLITQTGPLAGSELPLPAADNILGRDPGATVCIEADGISRRHAAIHFSGNQATLEDLGSSNGTYHNGAPVTQPVTLQHGDVIGLGRQSSFVFQTAAPEPAAADQEQTRARRLPGRERAPLLTVTLGQGPARLVPLEKEITSVGRAADNDIVVNSTLISRHHLRILAGGGRYRLEVLPEATNAVYLDDRPVTGTHPLSHGATIIVGMSSPAEALQLRLEAPDSPPAAGAQAGKMAAPAGAPPSPLGRTVIDRQGAAGRLVIPPRLLVTIAGNPVKSYELVKDRITIGRAADNDIVVDSPIVSRYHATLIDARPGYRLAVADSAGNPVQYQGRPVGAPIKLNHEDILRIGGTDPGVMVSLNYLSPAEVALEAQSIRIPDSGQISIGRHPDNDVVLDAPVVSHYHAYVERIGQRYRLRDLRSANGTFVNDQRIDGEVWLRASDEIRIGSHRFIVGDDVLAQRDESHGLAVTVRDLQKWVRKDLNILQNISLNFQPREFIVVVGQSGGGKSTLVDAIAGYRPATHGSVTVNGIDVYRNFDAIRSDIGFVPQKDIIHMELTVYEALDYTARLRMPPDTSAAERHQRIMEVLEDLDLVHRRDVPVSGLSGGQQKRVSIGVELLTRPGLFFLDEPTSGLDPGTETALMQLMRRLADQGRTIVLITHATKNVMLADKVVFLARGGYLCWFGPPDEALAYFDQFRTDRERRARDIEFDDVYAILDDPARGSPEEWAARYHRHPAHAAYVGAAETPVAAAPPPRPPRRRRSNPLRQLAILSARNVRILTRDRFSLFLMLAAAPLVSMLDVILSLSLGRNPFDYVGGNLPDVVITLFLPTVYGVMVGGISQMREIVKEQAIYRRERLVNLQMFPYIGSKIWVAALLALYQTAAYVIVHYIAFDMPGGLWEFALIYITLGLATMAGMMLGLFASALAPTPNAAPLIVILLMIPQIVLSGALINLPSAVTAPISTRWAFEGLMAITGTGADVAADACWLLPDEERDLLTQEYKLANCRCMGINAVNPESCDFPGVGQFFNPAVYAPRPVEPPPLRPEPAQPEIPPQPERPADESDQVAVAEYLAALEAWQAEAEAIQAAYEQEIATYRAEAEIFQATMVAHQTELVNWQIARASAIEPAEGLIDQFWRAFGWSFKNRDDPTAHFLGIAGTWAAQATIIVVLFGGILILQRRKDVV